MTVVDLQTEHRKNPVGIDEKAPRFSWRVINTKNNWKQKAYRIIVWKEEETSILWDSEKVESNRMLHIVYQGKELESGKAYHWKVMVWSNQDKEPVVSEAAVFEMGLLKESDWVGKWIGETEDFVNHIYRKTFETKSVGRVKRARLYICGLGHYEAYINGRRVGEYVLEPGWTNYDQVSLYSVYDVTKDLQNGPNAIGVFLGDGMYHVPSKRYVYHERTYGKMKCMAQLHITFEDGESQIIPTDESWRMAPSPITFSSIYGGEDYNAELEKDGFSSPVYIEDHDWKHVNIVERAKGRLCIQKSMPLKVMETYVPVRIWETEPGVYLYDLGKNFSGWVHIEVRTNGEQSGQTINLFPAEMLTKENKPDQRVTGAGYSWNYTCSRQKEQSYRPKFTYYGFRYVEVRGAVPKEYKNAEKDVPVIESLVGEFIYPDMKVLGNFSCSNTLLNGIHTIIRQAILSNTKSILTDCPHREKLGWLEQTHLIGPAILYNFDVYDLYLKIQDDMVQSQHESGLVPDICPEYVKGFEKWHQGYLDSPEWGSACIINLWHLYKKYGDLTLFEKYYPMMKKYIDYLTSKTHHHILHHGLGDWLDIGPTPPHSQNTPVPIVATAVYYLDLRILCEAAGMLGKTEERKYFENLLEVVKREYNLQFYDDQTYRYGTGSQAAQAMSLVTGLVDNTEEAGVLESLKKDIRVREYTTTAGDIGHPFVVAALMQYDQPELMYQMMNRTDCPSYGYQVKCGATTLTEEWDGPNPEHPRGSQNHFMLGSGEEWLYGGLGGIQLFRTENSFDRIRIKPYFPKDMEYLQVSHIHPYGKIEVQWKRTEEGNILIEIEVPPNTTAEFINEFTQEMKELGSGRYEMIV